jgi:hypothetical protein
MFQVGEMFKNFPDKMVQVLGLVDGIAGKC